jgi:hypothetical protein
MSEAAADDTLDRDALDIEALRRCVEAVLAAGDDLAEMVARKLKAEQWRSVALFCSYSQQMDNLRLRLWQSPPCYRDDPRDPQTRELADRLRAAGLSIFEPSPLEALAAKEKPKRR